MCQHGRRALAGLASVWLVLGAGTAAAHAVQGTQTVIQIAEPGVQMVFTVASLAVRRALKGRPPPAAGALWSVTADGRSCPLRTAAEPDLGRGHGGHRRFILQFLCADRPGMVTVVANLPAAAFADDVHTVQVRVAGHATAATLQRPGQRITVPIQALLRRWQADLAPAFFAIDPDGHR